MGGAGLIFGLMFLGLVVVAALLAVFVVVPWWRGQESERTRLTHPGHDTLVYEVPEGQDAVPILTALRQDGLDAVEVMRQGRQRILISGSEDIEQVRPRARAVIAHQADLNLEGDPAPRHEVTFVDE